MRSFTSHLKGRESLASRHLTNLKGRYIAAGRALFVFSTILMGFLGTVRAATFEVAEKSILDLQAAQEKGQVTSRGLVEAYLARIKAYDKTGPALNAIMTLNPHALQEADALDAERSRKGPRGPLHGIPVLVKDNYDTAALPTSAGTLGLVTMQPSADAYQVSRLRDAGAVILGKTTMHELAAGITNISSLTGFSRNPYDLRRVPGGSSGGSAIAAAASFATVAMGSDTCGSIRIPAANQNLFGLRVSYGISSRTGIVPLSSSQDVPGPLARSVTDLAIVLDATVGPDAADASTVNAAKYIPKFYRDALKPDALKGVRIGVLRNLFGTDPEDADTSAVVKKALDKMKAQGAEIVDVSIPRFDELINDTSSIAYEFKFDLADYLSRQANAPIKSLGEAIDRGLVHAQLDAILRVRNSPEKRDTPAYQHALERREALRKAVSQFMADQHIDVFAYPDLQRRPTFIGELQRGAATCQLSASTGFPAISIPAGFTNDGVPVGLELMGGPFTDASLLAYAYSWEQAVSPRRAPFSTPPLVSGHAPAPLSATVAVRDERTNGPIAHVKLSYDVTTSALSYDASAENLGKDSVVALTLQRSTGGRAGPVIAHFLTRDRAANTSTINLGEEDRNDLLAGKLFIHLYTHDAPLGAGRSNIKLQGLNS